MQRKQEQKITSWYEFRLLKTTLSPAVLSDIQQITYQFLWKQLEVVYSVSSLLQCNYSSWSKAQKTYPIIIMMQEINI